MKAHVTLVNPPYPSGAPQAVFIPLGISYLAAVLERDGYAVDVLDLQSKKITTKELETELQRLSPDILGVTSATLTYNPAVEIVKAAKRTLPDCLTLMGGSHVTILDTETLGETPEADIVVRGEGENTILELAKLVSENKLNNLGNVAGLTFRKNAQIVRTLDRPFIQDIDTLPYPAHKLFQMDRYKIFGKVYMPIVTSRGCPYEWSMSSLASPK